MWDKIKRWSGVALAIAAGIGAAVNAYSDKQKTDKIDMLIEKVEKLTDQTD